LAILLLACLELLVRLDEFVGGKHMLAHTKIHTSTIKSMPNAQQGK